MVIIHVRDKKGNLRKLESIGPCYDIGYKGSKEDWIKKLKKYAKRDEDERKTKE